MKAAAGRKACEDWIEMIDSFPITANHHAVAALETPNASACPDVDIVDALVLQHRGTTDSVLVEGVTPVDDNVAGLHQLGQSHDGFFGRLPRGEHDPGDARLFELRDEILQTATVFDLTTKRSRSRRWQVDLNLIIDPCWRILALLAKPTKTLARAEARPFRAESSHPAIEILSGSR